MPSLGSIWVELNANTGGFVSALSKAAAEAERSTKRMADSFEGLQRIASQTFGAFGTFNPAISQITFALEKMGDVTSATMKKLSGLGGGVAPLLSLGAGAAAGLALVDGAAIALAAHTAKTADEMYHMAESSGVSVEAFSRLSFVGKQYDIDQESIARGLQMMSVQMLKAATAGPGVTTAFDRLGLNVRKANGDLKDAGDMFEQIVAKLNALKEAGKTTEAVGFSREIFGRFAGGEVMRIPTDGLEKWSKVADQTGITISTQMGQAAHQLQTSMNTIGAAFDGAAVRLTAKLLPALNELASDAAALATNGSLQSAVSVIAGFVEGTLGVIDTFWSGLKSVWTSVVFALEEIGTPLVSIYKAMADAMTGHFKDAYLEMKDGAGALVDYYRQAAGQVGQIWADNAKFIKQVSGPLPPAKTEKGGAGADANTKRPGESGIPPVDQIADLVRMLNQQSSAELSLAANIQSTAAAEELRKAAAEADTKILQERNRLMDQQRTVEAELANAKKEQNPGATSRYTEELADVKKYLAELGKDAPLIRQRYQEIALAKSAVSAGEDLSIKETTGFSTQIAALQSMISAYKTGSGEIASVSIAKQLEEDRQKVQQLKDEYAALAAQDPQNTAALTALVSAIDTATEALAKHRAQLEQIRSLTIDESIAKQAAAFREELPAIEAVNAAYLRGADAVREAQVGLKVADFKNANPGASGAQIAAITELYRDQARAAEESSIAQKSAGYDVATSYADQAEELNKVREALQAAGQSTLLIDAAIDKAGDDSITKWDQAADQIGTMSERWRAFANEVTLSSDNTAGKFFETFHKGIDDLSSEIAKLAVTGKANFGEMFASIAEGLIKAEIQWSISKLFKPYAGQAGNPNAPGGTPGVLSGPLGLGKSIAGVFGLKIPGAGGGARPGPSGAAGDPIYVTMSTGIPGAGALSSTGNPLGFLFKKNDSSSGTGDESSSGGLFGSGGSGNPLSFLFGGGSNSSSGAGDGSSSNPFYSIMADDSGSPIGDSNPLSTVLSPESLSGLSGGAGSALSGGLGAIGSIFSLLPGFAEGGDVSAGVPIVVGEKGPEILTPRSSGRVLPNSALSAMQSARGSAAAGGAGDTHVHQYMTINTPDADSFRLSQDQTQAESHRAAASAFQRNHH